MTLVPADWNFNIFSLLSHIIWISTAVSDNGSLWTNVCPMKKGKTVLRDFFGFQCDIFSWEGGNPWVEWMDQRAQGRVGRPKWLKGWSKYVHLNLPPFQPTQYLPSTNQGSKPEKIWGRSKEEWMIYLWGPSFFLKIWWLLLPWRYHDYCKYTEIPFVFSYVFGFQ